MIKIKSRRSEVKTRSAVARDVLIREWYAVLYRICTIYCSPNSLYKRDNNRQRGFTSKSTSYPIVHV